MNIYKVTYLKEIEDGINSHCMGDRTVLISSGNITNTYYYGILDKDGLRDFITGEIIDSRELDYGYTNGRLYFEKVEPLTTKEELDAFTLAQFNISMNKGIRNAYLKDLDYVAKSILSYEVYGPTNILSR